MEKRLNKGGLMDYNVRYTNEHELGWIPLTKVSAESVEEAVEKIDNEYGYIGDLRFELKDRFIEVKFKKTRR